MRNSYAEKRLCLKYSLDKYLGDRQTHSTAPAGLHILTWLHGTSNRDIDNLLEHALEADIGLYPANYLYQSPPREIGLVMGFTPIDLEMIEHGIKNLAKLVNGFSAN